MEIFNNEKPSTDAIMEISRRVNEILYNPDLLKESGLLMNGMSSIAEGWEAPEEGWFKLNTDGAFNGRECTSACGGLIRNFAGIWINGFAMQIESKDMLFAELVGILLGLRIVKELGIEKIQLESVVRRP